MARILLVDDDPILLKVYQSKLTSEGFDIEAVSDGPGALKAIAGKTPPDLLLLDLMLPGMSGVEVIRSVRARQHARRLPIIVLSNLYLEEESKAAIAAGADLILAKANTTPRKVVEAIRGLLSVVAPPDIRPLPVTPPLAPPPTSNAPLPPPPGTPATASPSSSSGTPGNAPLPELPTIGNPAILRGPAALSVAPTSIRSERAGGDGVPSAEAFVAQIGPLLTEAKQWLTTLAQDPAALTNLGRTCKHLGNRAITAQRWDVAKLAAAGESLVHQVKESARYLTPSTVRTLTQVVDRLRVLAGAHTTGTDLASVLTLVLDDEGISRTTMGLALGKVGLQGTPMSDPRQALELLKMSRFHLILSDVMMNGMSGFQFATAVRAMPGYAHTPIIFVTALADFEGQFKASANGADDLIAKPFLLLELGTKALLHVLTGGGDPWDNR
jgi:CheY-like chemotaxis protein